MRIKSTLTSRILLSIFALVLAVGAGSNGFAQSTPAAEDPFFDDKVESNNWYRSQIEIGIGVQGGPTFSGVDKPSQKRLKDTQYDVAYPGFFGVGGGFGVFIEPRFFDIVGLEFGFMWEQSNGEGDINDQTVTISSTDLVFPIHFRIGTPGATKFVATFGVDFILPLSEELTTEARTNIVSAPRDVTTYLAAGIGIEIDALVMRIPIELRFRFAPTFEDTFDSRLEQVPPNIGYKANWEFQGGIFVGFKYAVKAL